MPAHLLVLCLLSTLTQSGMHLTENSPTGMLTASLIRNRIHLAQNSTTGTLTACLIQKVPRVFPQVIADCVKLTVENSHRSSLALGGLSLSQWHECT